MGMSKRLGTTGAESGAAGSTLIRSIGRWSLTALMINCIIGSGIFGLPGKLVATAGRASPLVMIVAGLLMGVIVFCYAEVASQFSEQGGAYLYARTAFGTFAGIQVGWFWFLAVLGSAAASADLFLDHLSGFVPWAGQGWPRAVVLTGLVLLPTLINYGGTRKGTLLSNGFTVAKLLPLVLLIVFGSVGFSHHARLLTVSELTAPGWGGWASGLLVLSFAYSGFSDPLTAAGEVREPRRSIPLALLTALGVCIAVYSLIQFVVVATLGSGPLSPAQTERPLAAVAGALLGSPGAKFVELAVMVSTYGWLSASLLNAPRCIYAMATHGEFPAWFGRLHPRFGTPHIALVVVAVLAWLLAVTGSFGWCLVLSAGAGIIDCATACAALLRLRRLQPGAARFRVPFGTLFSVLGLAICIVMLTQLKARETLVMVATALVAGANWWWARTRTSLAAVPRPVLELTPPGPGALE